MKKGGGDEGAPVRLFTPEEADRLVPILEESFAAIERRRDVLRVYVRELEALGVDLGQPLAPEVLARPEIEQKVTRALAEHKVIRGELDRLGELGVEVKSIDGLCDVRSRHEGRVVYLCWRRGESGFLHWHDLDTGFAGRQRILRTSEFEGTLLH